MRFLMSAVFLFSALAVPAPVSAEELKLAGTWVLTVDARGGQRDYYLELKQDGSKVSGAFISPRSGSFAIKEGTLKEGALKLVVPRNLGDAVRIFEILAKLGADGTFKGALTVDGNDGGSIVIKKDSTRPTVVGRWMASAGSKDGEPVRSMIEITADKDGKLSGRSLSDSGEFPLKDVKVDGKKLSYSLVLDFGGEKVTFVVEAELKGRFLMAGKWFDKADASFGGAWTANLAAAEGARRGARPQGNRRPEGRERPQGGERPEGGRRPEGRERPESGRGEAGGRRPPSTVAFVGKWYADVEMPGGEEQKFVFNFQLAGEKVAGSVKAGDGSSFKILGGLVEGRKITFKIAYNLDGVDVEVELVGELKGRGSITGSWTAEGEEGEWKSSRSRTL
ncbi:MAG: hypothetical protein VX958_02225 [Planctomycetota bacterium]|nr:hypothetical protein [Planctomycetota bacterium]